MDGNKPPTRRVSELDTEGGGLGESLLLVSGVQFRKRVLKGRGNPGMQTCNTYIESNGISGNGADSATNMFLKQNI